MKIMNMCAVIALSSLFSMARCTELPAPRLTGPPKPSEAKDSVEVTCISQKTGEKKTIWMYKGPGALIISDAEVCSKHFGEDFTPGDQKAGD